LRTALLQAAERLFVDQQRLPLTAAVLTAAHRALDQFRWMVLAPRLMRRITLR